MLECIRPPYKKRIFELPLMIQDGYSDQLPSELHANIDEPLSVYPSTHVTFTTLPNVVSVEFEKPLVGVGSPQSEKRTVNI